MYKKVKHQIIGEYLASLESQHDKSRLRLLYNIAASVFIMATTVVFISLFLKTHPVLVPAFGNLILAGLTILLIVKVNFSFAAKVYFIACFVLLFGNIIFNDGTMHIGAPFWITLLNIMVMYILGKWWGAFFMALSSVFFGYFIIYKYPFFIEHIHELPKETFYSAVYETVFVLFLVWYVIATILTASKTSDTLLKEQNKELIAQNNLITKSDHEKSVLLKEIHHRVKNNMQVIISLMRLQISELDSPEAIEKFNEMINRVLTMAKIHEKVYQSDELARINPEEYFVALSQDLLKSYEVNGVELNYSFDIEEIDLQTIVPIALIFNEMFSNSIKHAFEENSNPIITMSFKLNGDQVLFEYHDNGTWKEDESESGFGKDLIHSLVGQLDGEIHFEKEPATLYKIEFSLDQ